MVRDDKFVSIFKGHALLEKAERGSSASSPPPMYSPSSLSPPLRRASSSSPQAHIILFLQKASFVYLLALFEGTVLLGELFFARSRKAEVGRPSPSAPQGGHLALHPGPSELGNEETPFSPPRRLHSIHRDRAGIRRPGWRILASDIFDIMGTPVLFVPMISYVFSDTMMRKKGSCVCHGS